MGDSNSDEYRADDDRGFDPWKPHTFSWVEMLARFRDVDFGRWGTWDPPRRTGYAQNWSRSGATASDMIRQGQHTGLAAQIAAGDVTHVVLYIGTNDWSIISGAYEAIYSGQIQEAALQAKIDGFVADVTTAVDTLVAAGDPSILVIDVPDVGSVPRVVAAFPDSSKRAQVTGALRRVNEGLAAMAAARPSVTVVSILDAARDMLADVDKRGKLLLAGREVSVATSGRDPLHLQLADGAGHPSTIGSGLFANTVVIETMNEAWNLQVEPFSEEELVAYAFGNTVTSNRHEDELPLETDRLHSFPSPFEGAATLEFTLQRAGPATLAIFDILGRKVAVLVSDVLPAGRHRTQWQATGLPAGIYYGRLQTRTASTTIPLVLSR